MNSMRKLLCALTAVMVAVFAMPANAAPQKTYSLQLQIDPSTKYDTITGELVAPATMAVSVKNESPPPLNANSNIGSFTFKLSGLVMVPGPGDPNADPPIPPSPYCPTALCSIDATGSVLTVTNISPPIQAQGAFPVTFRVSSCGEGTIAPPASGLTKAFSGSQLSGAEFAVKNFNGTSKLSCGAIACGESFTVPVSTAICSTDPTNLACVTVKRGPNKDGVCATPADDVNYFATNTLSTTNLLHVEWATDPTAAFAYKLNAATGNNVNVSWLSSTSGPIFIQAPECRVDPANAPGALPLPRRYGQLASAVSASDRKISVTLDTGVAAPAVGDPINIGGERLVVTNVKNNSWSVDRRTAGTPIDNVGTSYLAGQPVMFTPLKLVPTSPTCYNAAGGTVSCTGTYVAGNQAQMCRASPITPNGGTFNYWVIDIGDGWMNPN